ncbi:olfactory receptor 1444-like [Bufo gargarizans]|uniref:olfactory receptor 1444-like n=1 Tax=Bufo gargarizans TaxID=30331 RepID=UPI001CF0F4DC|nr:olfactory receptor 1444-like [Bufo gargarizans]
MENITQVTTFVFSGLTDNEKLLPFLLIFFLFIYLLTIMSNIGIIALVCNTSRLHSPMYYFLSCLSLVDIFYSSVITPKMFSDLISVRKVISFNGCALQFFFYAALGGTETFLLSAMSYDRYIAVCHPLHYMSVMTKMKCLWMVIFSFSTGFFQSAVQTSCAFSLKFCGSNLIDHFYCDIPPLLKLSCSDTFYCTIVTIYTVGILTISSLMTILLSYLFILASVLRMKSTESRKKAFSTCSSHLMCASIFFVTIFITYLHAPSSVFTSQDKVASIFYSSVTPMLNPLIYTLRNQQVKKIMAQMVHSSHTKGLKNVEDIWR